MGKPYVSLAVQLLICCALMPVSAQPVAATPSPSPAPVTRNFKWDVEYIMWAPDCQQSVMIGINGRFPGPTITANAGDLIKVEVTNSLHTEGVVIHWHGIRQIGTPWADGTASISQCPINSGETFTYEFLADKPGTFFYHGHFGMQRAAGLYGSLIVNGTEQQPEPFAAEYDGELNMLLSDWYHENVYAQAAGLDGKDKHWEWVGEPQTLLIRVLHCKRKWTHDMIEHACVRVCFKYVAAVLLQHKLTVVEADDNPGVWAFHCHIESHLHLGMGVIFAEGMEKLRELNVPREAITCGEAKTAALPLAPAVAPSPP